MLTADLMRRGEFASLPLTAHTDHLRRALASRRVVVQSPPGTGKTTVVPPVVADAVDGRVLVTQPRRIAARAAARRLTQLTGTRPGAPVAHTVRGESTATGATRVEFMTTGVLLRRLFRDPELAGVGAVVLDEVHERHLDDDLALAMVAELAQLRDDLTIVAMSATLDAGRWAGLLGGAEVVAAESVLHPLEIRWAPHAGPATDVRGTSRGFLDHVARLTREAVRQHPDRSALVFVPGAWEVDQVVAGLSGLDRPVLPLHGRLDARRQDAALDDAAGPRVVVATAVAESSLTVPGVRIVVDSCLSREPRFDQNRGVSGLVTVRSSQASATQRAGRAARLGPGLAVRCLAAEDWAGMVPDSTPEVMHADLTGALLMLAAWGSPRGEGMGLPTPLPRPAVARAEAELPALGLVDDVGRITDEGRRVAAVPAEPRLAAALLAGAPRVGTRRAAEIVAFLSDDARAGDDLAHELADLRRASTPQARRWRDEAARLERLAPASAPTTVPDDAALAWLVASARPGWISRRRADRTYTSASGTGFVLPPGSRLAGEWLAVWDSQRSAAGPESRVRAAVAIDEAAALEAGAHLLEEAVDTRWEDGRVRARATRRLGAITLTATPVRPDREQAERALREALLEDGVGAVLGWGDEASRLRRRLAVLRRSLGEPWPEVGDAALAARLDEWLAPEIAAVAGGAKASDLAAPLRRLLPWQEAGRLDELAPERITVPTGSAVRLDYPEVGSDAPVVLAVKLQECFGWTATPTICAGRERLLLHLLSPAGRPLAVTADLASFWAGAYASVRAENRGRYPKHPWPEDPLTARPMRGTTRSGR